MRFIIEVIREIFYLLRRGAEMWFGGVIVLVDGWIELTRWAWSTDDDEEEHET